jgi:protein-S-isoprenylcysteine O-methyltransferase Ste14
MITEEQKTEPVSQTGRGILLWAVQMIAALLIFGIVLFLLAGRLNWTAGWVYLGLNAVTQLLSALVLIPRQAGMLAERSKVREGTKSWDRVLTPAITIGGTIAVLFTAGLDARFGWSAPINNFLWVASIAVAFASQMFVLWAMASNAFFALTVRIQSDRNQTVTQHGPYQIVRHPGYAGSLIYNLMMPLLFGSWWTYIPAVLTCVLLFIRTGLEDRTLQAELPGYQAYAARVHYRLIPGIW